MRVIVSAGFGKLEETFVAFLQDELMASDFIPHQIGADGPGDFRVPVRIASGAQRGLIGLMDGACLDERKRHGHREIIGDDRFEIFSIHSNSERVVWKTFVDLTAYLLDSGGSGLIRVDL